jgi:hypothetical protein
MSCTGGWINPRIVLDGCRKHLTLLVIDKKQGKGTGYPETGFRDIPESQQAKRGLVNQINHHQFSKTNIRRKVDDSALLIV